MLGVRHQRHMALIDFSTTSCLVLHNLNTNIKEFRRQIHHWRRGNGSMKTWDMHVCWYFLVWEKCSPPPYPHARKNNIIVLSWAHEMSVKFSSKSGEIHFCPTQSYARWSMYFSRFACFRHFNNWKLQQKALYSVQNRFYTSYKHSWEGHKVNTDGQKVTVDKRKEWMTMEKYEIKSETKRATSVNRQTLNFRFLHFCFF